MKTDKARSKMDQWEKEMEDREDVEAIKRMAAMKSDRPRLNRALATLKKQQEEMQKTSQAVEKLGLRRKSTPRKKRQGVV